VGSTATNTPQQGTYSVPTAGVPPVVRVIEGDVYNGYIIEPPKPIVKTSGRIGSAAALVAGGALTLVGIPLLVLPGPGLLTIAGGTLLIKKGRQGLRRKP